MERVEEIERRRERVEPAGRDAGEPAARPPRGRAVTAVLVALLAALPAAAGAPRTLALSQVHQLEGPGARVRAYLDLLDAEGRPVTELAPEALAANLGEDAAQVERLEPLTATGQGVAYVFLVDISRSLSAAQFEEIREAIRGWIAGLAAKDRAAILSFGDESRLVVDFTADHDALAAGIDGIGPTDGSTLLHRAIVDGLELTKRRDPDLPGRRVLVVLTDGRDEGSGLAAEDVLARLRGGPAPLYAIGYSQLRDPGARRRYLDLLHRFASNSGGAFFEADRTRFVEAYARIRTAVRRVWLADLRCPACRTDGNEYWLQVTVDAEGRVLSQGTSVRLLPVAGPPPAPRPAAPVAAPAPTVGTRPDAPAAAETSSAVPADGENGPGPPAWLWWLAAFAAIAAILWLGSRLRRPAPVAAPAADEEVEEVPASETETVELKVPSARLAQHVRLRGLRFVVVRGSRPGRQYRLMLQDRAVVGSRSSCDCILTDEANIAPNQFELTQDLGQIYIRNLSEASPTLYDGLPIGPRQIVRSGDLIGTREVILRVVLD